MPKKALPALLVLLFSTNLLAQKADPDTLDPFDKVIMERITVIGKPAWMDKTPGSATYLDNTFLQKQNYSDVNRVLRSVSGVNIQEEDGFGLRPNIGLRGTGVERSSKITLMEDGILIAPAPYAAPAAYYFPSIGRMSSVEVRKGSSQVKYGPYTTGGAINLISTRIPYELSGKAEVSAGEFNSGKLHASVGNTYKNTGFLIETLQMRSNGFKDLDSDGNTGFNVKDFVGKFMLRTNPTAPIYQKLEFKIGYYNEISDETYLGLTQQDFENDPYRRYAGSQIDEMDADQTQFSVRHFAQFSESLDLTTTLYRNDFNRNWYKLDKVNGVGIGSLLANPQDNQAELNIVHGTTSNDDALSVKANNREYYAQGIQSVLGARFDIGNASSQLELGLRYHEDGMDRFQWVDGMMRQATKDGMTSDEGATIRNGRMVIPIQAEFKRKIQGFIHDVSATGQTVYLEPVEALHLNNEIRQFEIEERQEIERILRELTNHVRQHSEFLTQNAKTLAKIDVIASKAKVSIKLDAEIPIVSPDFNIKLKSSFNANLLLKNLGLKKEEKEMIIPLDLNLTSDELCLMITGPNAGGKSVAMKTLGISALMMQSGFAIPADPTSELPIFSGFFVDLGDDQSIENDLSTFSSRLKWMQETLDNFSPKSLVLIDEAAAGTDPEEGGALFQSFIEHLLGNECKVVVTTHHGSLKVFAHEHQHAVNGSMEFDQTTLSPTYKFKKGIPGSSYAFEIAQRMNIKQEVLDRSRTLLGQAKDKMESLITELETKTQQAEELKAKFQNLKSKAETDRNRYLNKLDGVNKEKEKIRQKALIEAKSIMDQANRKVEQAVEKIVEEKKTGKKDLKSIRSEIDQEKAGIESSLNEIKEQREARFRKSEKPPSVGDHVRFLDGNTTGELVELKGKQAVVQADGLRLKTKYKNLVKVETRKQKKQKARSSGIITGDSSLKETVKPSIDLRGYRADKALDEVMHYLDRALFRGMNQVEIVHGKGDGILKDQIHSYLNERSEVKSFKLANEDFGGAGCTVVKLQ